MSERKRESMTLGQREKRPNLIEWVHTEASLDEHLLSRERGLCCKILLTLNPAVGAESSENPSG